MTNRKPADPLDSLQFMLNDLIVQIGKALRASSKQPGRRDVAVVQAILQNHVPSSIESFHSALDDMETEIIRAKAVLRRDLDNLQSQSLNPAEQAMAHGGVVMPMPAPDPAPKVEPVRTPESSIQLSLLPQQALSGPAAPTAPMAPVPDMGGSMVPTEIKIKRELVPSAPQALMEPAGDLIEPLSQKQPGVPQPAAPHVVPEAPMDDLFDLDDASAAVGSNAGEFNFTDITFSLAPVNSESQEQPQAQQTEMDASSFGNDDMSSLDNMLAMEAPVVPGPGNDLLATAMAARTSDNTTQGAADKNNPAATDSLDDMFTLAGDGGMDLDMNLGGGDNSNFDSMFFTELEDVKYDDAFFNIG